MASILTSKTLLSEFDDSLATNVEEISKESAGGIVYESLYFYGRETGKGRVKIFATFAHGESGVTSDTILILPDSLESIDKDILKMFVDRGYNALMVDYRGEWENVEYRTVYPDNIVFANTLKCGRYKDYVDISADKTSWYEWVAVGIYARKYIVERTASENIALVGIRDGGEVAWKLATARKFSCLVPVCAAGWLAYAGICKLKSDEKPLDSERYRFIAGIDSQAYAPYVKCPVILLCSTNDPRMDYDRAFDTFSRINPDFANESEIAYSLQCNASIGLSSTENMFLFLGKYLNGENIVIPQPVDISISVDEEQNLLAVAKYYDSENIVDRGVFIAENSLDPTIRDWKRCFNFKKIADSEYRYYLDIYEETSTLFTIGYARYKNGFTVWSKIIVKKISGRFKNTQSKCRVVYSSKKGADGFYVAEPRSLAIGGIFFTNNLMIPQVVTKTKGISGLYSEKGLTTYRIGNPMFSPKKDNILKIDVFCDETSEMTFTVEDINDKETYRCSQSILGGVWQSLILEGKFFKSVNGVQLANFTNKLRLCINCDGQYAINNVMWL